MLSKQLFVRMQNAKELFTQFLEFYTSRQAAEQRMDSIAQVRDNSATPSLPKTQTADNESAVHGIVSGKW